jgi:GR25 family glycosyltransferase involved in LPS biosynthesis
MRWIAERTEWVQRGNDRAWAGHGRAYVVALPTRLESIRGVMRTLRITPWILNAVHKSSLTARDLQGTGLVAGSFLRQWIGLQPGRIACFLSHVAVLQHFVTDPSSPATAIIFEDDLEMPKLDAERDAVAVQQRLSRLGRRWDVLFYGWCFQERDELVDLGGGVYELQPLCAHAYAITKDAARRLLARLLPMDRMLDNIIQDEIRAKRLAAFGPSRPLFWQDRQAHASSLTIGGDLTSDTTAVMFTTPPHFTYQATP